MARKKLNALIALCLFCIFAVSVFVIFSSCKSGTVQEFTSQSENFENILANYNVKISSGEFDNISIEDFVKMLLDGNVNYPATIAVYTYGKNPELVCFDSANVETGSALDAYNSAIKDKMEIDVKSSQKDVKKQYALGGDTYALGSGSAGSSYGSDIAQIYSIFSYENKSYYLAAEIGENENAQTFFSNEFKSEIQVFTLLYAIICFLIFVFSNKLYLKNRRLEESRRAFISAAAHELKTPLAIIENQSEFIVENVNPEKNEEYIKSIYDESRRMDRLVKDLLRYNRLASAGKIKKTKCSLSEIAAAEAEKYKPLAEQKGVQIKTAVEDGVIIRADGELIALAVDNFLSNAVKHTPQGKHILVTLEKARLSVFNEGDPVTSENADSLFDAFSKTDKARENDGSSGMGLAITREIFELHRFKYGFKNRKNGVEFYFEFK